MVVYKTHINKGAKIEMEKWCLNDIHKSFQHAIGHG
jgi:hypothetical protein